MKENVLCLCTIVYVEHYLESENVHQSMDTN